MNIDDLPTLEREALYLLLEGTDLTRRVLRAQLSHVAKIKREETGAGVYVDFEFREEVPVLENRDTFQISGVSAESPVCDEIDFLLFVKEGIIDFLEAYVSADSFPSYTDCNFNIVKNESRA